MTNKTSTIGRFPITLQYAAPVAEAIRLHVTLHGEELDPLRVVTLQAIADSVTERRDKAQASAVPIAEDMQLGHADYANMLRNYASNLMVGSVVPTELSPEIEADLALQLALNMENSVSEA